MGKRGPRGAGGEKGAWQEAREEVGGTELSATGAFPSAGEAELLGHRPRRVSLECPEPALGGRQSQGAAVYAGGAQARPGGDSTSPASGDQLAPGSRCRLPRPALTSDTALVSTSAPLPSDLKRREARMVEGFLLGHRLRKGTKAGTGHSSRSEFSSRCTPSLAEKAGRCGDPTVLTRVVATDTSSVALFPPSQQEVASLMPKRVCTEAPLFLCWSLGSQGSACCLAPEALLCFLCWDGQA